MNRPPEFRALVRDLEAHGAPARLIESAKQAIRDEQAHARTMAAIAKRFGARVTKPTVNPRGVQSLEELAIHNATEGCVGESMGALVAMFQARHSRDGEIAAAMSVIAEDETRHAQLAREIAAWTDGLLDLAARRRVRAAQDLALNVLRRESAFNPNAELLSIGGLPTAAQAQVLSDRLTLSLA